MQFYLFATFFRTNNWRFSTLFCTNNSHSSTLFCTNSVLFCKLPTKVNMKKMLLFHTDKGHIFTKPPYKKMSAKPWEQPTVWRTIFLCSSLITLFFC